MRYLWSAGARTRKNDKQSNQRLDTQISDHTKSLRCISAFMLSMSAPSLLFISGCNPKDTSIQLNNQQSELARQQQDVAAIQDNIQNSYAHLAAKRSDGKHPTIPLLRWHPEMR